MPAGLEHAKGTIGPPRSGCLGGCLGGCFGGLGPSYNSWNDSRKEPGKKTLVCVAGLASSALTRSVQRDGCCIPGLGELTHREEVSYCSISALAKKPKSTLNSLRLKLVDGKLEDGTEVKMTASEDSTVRPVQGTAGIRTLNPGEAIPVSVWDGFIDDLEGTLNCHAFNYDWRRWGDAVFAEQLVDQLKERIMTSLEKDGNSGKKAAVVGHSMGAPLLLYCLSKMGKKWQQAHLERVILVAPAHTGSPSMIPSFGHAPFLAQETAFVPRHCGEDLIGDIAATWACMIAEMPTEVAGVAPYSKDHVFARTPQKEYKLSDMGAFLDDLAKQVDDRQFGSALWPGFQRVAGSMKAPEVPTMIIYSSGLDTPCQFEYDSEQLDTRARSVNPCPGDGTITRDSIVAVAKAWGAAGHHVELVEAPGAIDHKTLIADDFTVAVVERSLEGGSLTPVEVTVVSASGLKNADMFGKSDPYCVVELESKTKGKKISKRQTKTVKDNLDPVWNKEFTFYAYSDGDHLVFSIFDEDKFRQGDHLGMAQVSADQIKSGFDGELQLEMKSGSGQGVLTVKVSPPRPYTHASERSKRWSF